MVNEISDSLAPPPLEKERSEPNRIEIIEEEFNDDTEVSIAEPFNLVVWDDNIHTEEYFIEAFVKHFSFSPIESLSKVQDIKAYNRSIVLRGSFTDMEFHALALDMNYKISATVENG